MNIAIIGAGVRGTGIAQVAALHGHNVAVYDLNAELLQRAKLRIAQSLDRRVAAGSVPQAEAERVKNAIGATTALEQFAEADFLIEAAPETLEVKQALFERLDRFSPRTSVLASTTTTFPISVMAAAAKRHPERVIGMAFQQPIPTHSLVEVVTADQTASDTAERALYLLRNLGKTPVTTKDTPGRITTRLSTVYTGEALRLLGEGHVSPETVDTLMTSLGVQEGPFRIIDAQGVDEHLTVTQALYDAYYQEARYRPHPIQQKMVQSNHLGRKTRRGFYSYDA
ncbi:MAG: 3-hydroxyacyl-CoA dehydrogenase family protein [Anaerolineales bacterium]